MNARRWEPRLSGEVSRSRGEHIAIFGRAGRGAGATGRGRTTASTSTMTSGDQRAVMRLRVADGRIEKVATLTGFGEWFGLDPGDAPLLLRNTGNQQIYALDCEAP